MRGRRRVTFELGDRWIAGLALLLWGAGVALSGLGLGHTEASRLLGVYWPLPFMAYGILAIGYRAVTRQGGLFTGVLVLLASSAFLASNLYHGHLNVWDLFWALALLALGVEIFGRGGGIGEVHGRYLTGDRSIRGSRFSGRGRRLHHILGDIRLDLSEIETPEGETPVEVSSVVGDITLLVPRNLAVSVVAETTVGDLYVFGETAEGVYPRLSYETPGYEDAPRRLAVYAHLVMGDITVKPF